MRGWFLGCCRRFSHRRFHCRVLSVYRSLKLKPSRAIIANIADEVPERPSGNDAPCHPIRVHHDREKNRNETSTDWRQDSLQDQFRYEITKAPQLVYTCHCVDCQRLTSSAFSMVIVVTDVAFRIAGIEPRAIQRTADSGAVVTRWVCPECGSWVCGASSSDHGLRRLRAGTLDDTSWLRPTAHFLDPQQAALDYAARG